MDLAERGQVTEQAGEQLDDVVQDAGLDGVQAER
jgi:hypothetical protein